MHDLLDWLGRLPDVLLYGAIALAAFAENVFPPLPADSVVALGAFVAARGNGTAFGAWAATMLGNIGGAMLMFFAGRRFGMPWLSKKFPSLAGDGAASRFEATYRKYGLPGLMVSRFLPAVRAVVPPVAGAIGIGALRALIAMTIASGAWYAFICWLAFHAGANSDALLASIGKQQRTVGFVAAGIVALVAVLLWLRHRRRSTHRKQ